MDAHDRGSFGSRSPENTKSAAHQPRLSRHFEADRPAVAADGVAGVGTRKGPRRRVKWQAPARHSREAAFATHNDASAA